MASHEGDRAAILEIHKNWWEANHELVIPLMQSCFPGGDSYLMFNANGHPYFGIDEKTQLWEWYQNQLDIVAFPEVQIMRLTISGDMAWLACEANFPMQSIGEAGTGSSTWEIREASENFMRATEVYERNDGNGNPEWKMWHFHASPLPPKDEERPGLGGTLHKRGLGGGRAITSQRVTRDGKRTH